MSTYVLVLGAYHGAYCYAKVIPRADVTPDGNHSPFLSAPQELAD